MRSLVAKMKLIPNRAMLEGKRVLFCDDSIVRGTQLRDNVKILYDYGAKEVHMRIACPPLIYSCPFLGFTASKGDLELITRRMIKEIEGDENKDLEKYAERNIAVINAKKNVLGELKKYLETVRTILSISELIKSQEWYQEIREVDSLAILIADGLAHGAPEQTADPAEILDDDRTIETIKVAVIGDLLFGSGCTQIVGYGIARNHLNEGKDEQSDKQNGDAGLHHTLADHFGKVVRFHSLLHFLRNLSPLQKQIPAQLPAPESAEIRRNVFRS